MQCTSMAEYPLSGLPASTTYIKSSINTSTQPTLNFPSVVNPPSTANDPKVTNAGLWITPQKYVIPSGIWTQSPNTCTELNFWFFYVSGIMGQFAGVGLQDQTYSPYYLTVNGILSGSIQILSYSADTFTFNFGEIKHGWNVVSFEMCNSYFRCNFCQVSGCSGYTGNSLFGGVYTSQALFIGCKTCTDSNVSYLIQSIHSTQTQISCVIDPIPNTLPNTYISNTCGNKNRESGEGCDDGNVISGDGCNELCSVEPGYTCTSNSPNPDTCTQAVVCGNNKRESGEGCDDGNTSIGDGCNSSCSIETGWTCTGGSTTSKDTCTEICGDSKRFNSVSTYCDDGNISSGDGCSLSCGIETGWTCSGGTTTTKDTCGEICGDGKRFNLVSSYCDDGNILSGDGCGTSCSIESGWNCSGGSTSSKDTCTEICGDGKRFNSISTYCDDSNNLNGDGCNSICGIETGWSCSGGTTLSKDVCTEICGDGIKFNSISTYCDDGNSVNGDGCSSGCAIEFGFNCSGGSTTTKDTCTEVCGDGRRFNSLSTFCDDGNNINGDGCNSVCGIEVGYVCSGGTTTSKDICSEVCGDGIRFNSLSTYCDDGNIANGDGCSSGCAIESGWSCSGGSTTTKDTCTEICGDGKRFNSIITYCDDGNTSSNDGCSSTCAIESGWSCSGGTTTSADSCIDICGDGKVVKPAVNYCDDGNLINGDGCNGSCAVETGWSCPGGSISSPSVCSEICGDGITIVHNALKCDDGNTVNGDGCSSTCFVETGWGCTGGSSTKTDVCTIICGDGIYMSQAEQCDDGNLLSGDGCSQLCKLESGYSCSTNVSNNPATTCQETCGDGRRFGPTGCDDGNTVSGDGCSSTCTVEPGYSCQGGSSVSSDTCLIICGDGKNDSSDPSVCDDGNNINGDGCSSTCNVELGFKCSHTTTTPDVCTEICGDGRRIGLGCDDGNTSNGDGCNSNCQIEPGFTCSGGSSTKRDICTETCGDGKDFGTLDCDDGNTSNGDGCSSTCEFETCYECKGGTPTNPDTCSKLQIGATIGKVGSDNSVDISFDHTMLNKSIGLNDLYVQIESSSSITFSWSAAYTNSTLLHLSIGVSQVLQGTEILHVKFINNKVFRGPYGGCVRPDSLNATMPNSLASSVDTASSAGSPLKYITMIGILVAMGALLLLGGTLELIWSLVNTLQLLSYLPLMVPNYPQHVQLMFELLGFTNLDIQFISDFVKSTLHLDELNAPSYDSRFMDNGIGNSLFLSNCASILFSLFFSLMTLIVCATLYSLLWCSKVKSKMSGIVSSYFFNNFLRFFSEGYLEIYFGALLNVMTYDFNSPVEIVSFVVSCAFLFLLVIFPFMSAALIYDKRKQIREKNPVYLKRFGTMYQNFKLKGSWFSMQYYPIFLLRRLIFASFIIIAINYPEFQCNSFTFFSVVIFFYQLYMKPFKEEVINILSCINECCLAFISMIQVIFLTDFNSVQTIEMTGWVMVALMSAMIFINLLIVVPYTVYTKIKECKEKSKVEDISDPVMTKTALSLLSLDIAFTEEHITETKINKSVVNEPRTKAVRFADFSKAVGKKFDE